MGVARANAPDHRLTCIRHIRTVCTYFKALTPITLAEVLSGPHKAGQTALAARYEQALAQFEWVNLSPSIANLAAQLRARYGLKLPDALQLAAALDIGAAALVTHDRDFSKVEGLPVLYGA